MKPDEIDMDRFTRIGERLQTLKSDARQAESDIRFLLSTLAVREEELQTAMKANGLADFQFATMRTEMQALNASKSALMRFWNNHFDTPLRVN